MREADHGAPGRSTGDRKPGLQAVPAYSPHSGMFPGVSRRLPRTIAVASGKGGVGKTSLTLNLALSLAEMHQRVLVVDGDFGLGKMDLLLGAKPVLNLGHVLEGSCTVDEAVFIGPRGVCFLPGACGAGDLAVLDRTRRERFLHSLEYFSGSMDLILLDLATGIGPNSVELARQAEEVMLVTTPEPTAYADAYALIKILSGRRGPGPRLNAPRIVVNRVRNDVEAQGTFLRLSRTARRHLDIAPVYWGAVPEDEVVGNAVREQKPFALTAPDAPASRRVRELAWRLLRGESPDGGEHAGLGMTGRPVAPGASAREDDAEGPRTPLWKAA